MSGVRNQNTDWQEKLSSIKSTLADDIGYDKGGFVPTRHRRKSSSHERIDPFGEVVVVKKRRDRSGKSEDASRGAELLFLTNPEDIGGMATGITIGDEEVNTMSQNNDQSSENEDHSNNPNYGSKRSSGSKREYAEGVYEQELSPEQLAERARVQRKNAKIKKVGFWGGLLFGTLGVTVATVAVAAGLMGKHKSNIMNM
jgi:hypothetical protein